MHEWALAEAVITAILDIAKKENLKELKEVRISIGELQQIEQDIFEFALNQMKSDILKNTRIKIRSIRARLKCKNCGNSWRLDQQNLESQASEAIHFIPELVHTYMCCPKCKSPDFDIVEGRGMFIESVKGAR